MKQRFFWHSFWGVFIIITLIIFIHCLDFLDPIRAFIGCYFKSILIDIFDFIILMIKTENRRSISLFMVMLIRLSLNTVYKPSRYFTSSKKSSYFTFTWIRNQLLYQSTSSEEFILTVVSSLWFLIFNVYGLTSGFEKTHSWIIDIWIKHSCYYIIYQFNCNFLMLRLAEEYFIYLFKYSLNYYSHGKYYHWHHEVNENSFSWKLTFAPLLNLCNWNK